MSKQLPPRMEAPINFYTSASPDGQFYTLVRLTGENLGQPVALHSYAQLPAPDTTRPTKQQLRAERAALGPVLAGLHENIRLVEGSPSLQVAYLEDLSVLHGLRARYEERLTRIEQLLSAPVGEEPARG